MENDELQATWHYHQGTKHPGGPLLNPYHRYTPADRPYLYKVYEGLEPIPLPKPSTWNGIPALEAIAPHEADLGARVPGAQTITRLLHFSAGITKRIDYGSPAGKIAFRAASCTGALYHIELYLVCGDLPGLEAGVYHFDPRQNALRQLRQGDYRTTLGAATGGAPAVVEAPVLFLYSSVFWRNAVKYQARAYRHAFWDSGTILANTLAVSAAHNLPAQVVMGFVDKAVNRLLGLDGKEEAVLELLAVGRTEQQPSPAAAEAEPEPEPEPLSPAGKPVETGARQVLQPIQAMHAASSLEKPEQVEAWRGEPPALTLPEPSGRLFPLAPPTAERMPADPLATVIKRRGSSRRFHREPIHREQLATMLHQAVHGFPADFSAPPALSLCQVYLIVNAVAGLPAGAYVYHRDRHALELLQEGSFRRQAGELALGQDLGRDASVNIYFLADLEPILDRFGNRGYRAAQLEASVAAGWIYLAAYAQHLGASGLTFFDDGVTAFFSPHAAEKSVLFLIAVGQPAPRR